MLFCPECGSPGYSENVCTHCSAVTSAPAETEPLSRSAGRTDDWETIARFANAAEAGYFANELHYALNFEPRLECREDFDTLGNLWRSTYVLSVPEQLAEQGRRQFELILRGESVEPAGSALARPLTSPRDEVLVDFARDPSETPGRQPVSGVNWVPIMLTLAAGSLVLWGGKKLHVQRRPGPAPGKDQRIDVWDALTRDGSFWTQSASDGQGVRELDIHRDEGTVILREDADGDGAFESETLYHIDRN